MDNSGKSDRFTSSLDKELISHFLTKLSLSFTLFLLFSLLFSFFFG